MAVPIHGRMKTISFIAHKACLLWAVWLTASDSASALDPTRDRILYAVGYGHLDDQWNWTIQETINNFIPDSLHQNIGRWLGPDGQSMIAVVNPGAYSQPVTDNLANDSYHYSRISNTYAESGLYLDYMYFGNSGDQGGGPSASSVSNVCLSVQTTNGLINVLSAG